MDAKQLTSAIHSELQTSASNIRQAANSDPHNVQAKNHPYSDRVPGGEQYQADAADHQPDLICVAVVIPAFMLPL